MNDRIAESSNRIALIRQQLGVSTFRNIAIADWEIEDETGSLVAISGQATRPGCVSLPETKIFTTFEVPPGHSRAYDSEYKILENLAGRIGENPEKTGTIDLFTERPPVPPVVSLSNNFAAAFPTSL